MEVVITLPGIKAVSRNQTTGNYWKYRSVLMEAEQWMLTFGKRYEYHFTKLVDVDITAYYKVGYSKIDRKMSRLIDTPNIDDKIFTDCLIRYKQQGTKGSHAIERPVWFIEDDNPKYLRFVTKRSIPSDEYKVVISIKEVDV